MSNDITVKESELMIPEYLKKDKDLGDSTIRSEDIVIPRLKICQALSKIAREIPIKNGQIYNTVTKDIYAPPLNFFVLLHWPSRVWFSGDQKLRCQQYQNVKTKEWISVGREVEECLHGAPPADPKLLPKDSQNYMIVLESELKQSMDKKVIPLPMIYSAISAAIKFARQLNMKIKTNAQRNIPIYGQMISISTNEDPFPKSPAWMPRFNYGRWATANEFKFLEQMYFKCTDLQSREEVHVEADQEDPIGEPPDDTQVGRMNVGDIKNTMKGRPEPVQDNQATFDDIPFDK
jgi:hypothetical protein